MIVRASNADWPTLAAVSSVAPKRTRELFPPAVAAEKFIVCISDGPVDAGPNIISSVGGMITSSALKNNSTTKRSGSTITTSWPGGKMPQFVLWHGKQRKLSFLIWGLRSDKRRVGTECDSKDKVRWTQE